MFRLKKKPLHNCKILFIAPDVGSGGAENILFNVIKERSKEEVFVVSLKEIGFYGKKLIKNGYKVYSLNMKKNIFIFFKVFKLFLLIIKLNPSIVHTWLYHGNLLGGTLAKIAGIKKIYWSIHHDFEYSNLLMKIEMKILILLSYFVPNKIIYCSSLAKSNHIKNGYKKNNSITINNGVDLSKYKPNKKYRRKIREELNISEDCLLIGNISRYNQIKDHDNLLKALNILNQYDNNFKCILVGIGLSNRNSELINKIEKNKLLDKVLLYGKSYEVKKILNALDINVLSSLKEGFGMVLLEAMSSGTPCLSTDVGAAKIIIDKTGWLVKTSNPIDMAECLLKISRNKNIIKQKSKLVRNRIKKLFSLEKMNEKYKNLYI